MDQKLGCLGKVQYSSLKEAIDVKKRIPKGHVEIYKCDYDDHYHLTSMHKRIFKRIRTKLIKGNKWIK